MQQLKSAAEASINARIKLWDGLAQALSRK
jgi:hypothetical protein